MKLTTPDVNFINVQAAFACTDPKCTKKTVKLSVFFALLGSASVKAVHRMLMKLSPSPGANFIHILLSPFLYKSACFAQLFSNYSLAL